MRMKKRFFIIGLILCILLFYITYLKDSVEWLVVSILYFFIFIIGSILLSVEHNPQAEKEIYSKISNAYVNEDFVYVIGWRSLMDLIFARLLSSKFRFVGTSLIILVFGVLIFLFVSDLVYRILSVFCLLLYIIGSSVIEFIMKMDGGIKYAFTQNYVFLKAGFGRRGYIFVNFSDITSYRCIKFDIIFKCNFGYRLIGLTFQEFAQVCSILESKGIRKVV